MASFGITSNIGHVGHVGGYISRFLATIKLVRLYGDALVLMSQYEGSTTRRQILAFFQLPYPDRL